MRISIIILFLMSTLFASSLYKVTQDTISNSYKLKSYKYQANAQNYKYKQSKDNYLPTISANINLTKDRYQYEYSNPSRTEKYNSAVTSYNIQLKQTIYNPKIFSLIDENKLKIEYVNLKTMGYKQKLLNDVVNTYIDAINYQTISKIYDIKVKNYQKLLNSLLEKQKLHFATKTDIMQAKSKLASAKSDYIHSILNYQNAIKKLNYLTHSNIIIPEININNEIASILEFETDNINNNPDIRLANMNIQIAKNEIQKRRYNKYPNLNFSASYSNSNSSDSITKKKEYTLALNLNIPIYNAVNNDYQNEATELYLSSQEDYKDILNSVKIDEKKTIYIIQQFIDIIKKDKEVIKTTNLFLEQQKISYNNRLTSLSDLYNAQNDHFSATIQFEKDKAVLLQNYINLLYIQGKLDLSTIQKIQNLYLQGE